MLSCTLVHGDKRKRVRVCNNASVRQIITANELRSMLQKCLGALPSCSSVCACLDALPYLHTPKCVFLRVSDLVGGDK
jgi:hypothetical protein